MAANIRNTNLRFNLGKDTLFKKMDLFIVQSAVALCVLLDVFQ